MPVYTTVVADSWSLWYWDCYGYDYHWDYDWFWGPSWYYGADWYSGYDWTWTPSWYWWDFLNYYYCYWVYVEIYGTTLVQGSKKGKQKGSCFTFYLDAMKQSG